MALYPFLIVGSGYYDVVMLVVFGCPCARHKIFAGAVLCLEYGEVKGVLTVSSRVDQFGGFVGCERVSVGCGHVYLSTCYKATGGAHWAIS